ncbi:MAG TPA: hypothetical protein PLB45_02755 [Bacilli bacterium]|jgi:hypothetical protein|nr:hypothetical protein [Bacilli bacterium]HQC83774.1 hypothetical protein [Bacilli bacterium]
METKKTSRISWCHVICCIIILIIFVVTIGIHINAAESNNGIIASSNSANEAIPLTNNYQELLVNNTNSTEEDDESQNEVELAGPKEEVTVIRTDIDSYITTYNEDIKLLATAFSVNYEDVVKDLYSRYESNNSIGFEKTNVGYLLNQSGSIKKYNTVEYGLVEYFYDYIEKNPKKVNNKWVPYTGKSDYVEKLIIYFSTRVYTNVDTALALSIGAAESGYYTSTYMLAQNNIYGGMSSSGLIRYRNIEFGVLSYVKYLSNNYFGKGLNTISEIGYVYCPTIDSNGYKVASPHWEKLVSTAMNKYEKYNFNVTMSDLI